MTRTSSTTPRITRSQRRAHLDIDTEQPTTDPGQPSSATTQGRPVEITENQEPIASSPVLGRIGDDEASNNFLEAFRQALHACSFESQDPRHWKARERCLDQLNDGLVILRQRLGNEQENCSDETLQAVLVLFVFATRFQTEQEASSHRAALERMIDMRGGLASFGHNEVLEQQLQRYASGEIEMILHIRSGPGPPP